MNARATFTSMEHSTAADWAAIGAEFPATARTLPDRILGHLKLLDGDMGGFPIDRYQHSLQTAQMYAGDLPQAFPKVSMPYGVVAPILPSGWPI